MTQRYRQHAMSSLRIALSALIASSACNACSAPTPTQPAVPAPASAPAPAPSTTTDMPATSPPPPPAVEPPAPEPTATEPAAGAPPKTQASPPRQATPPPVEAPPQPTSIVIYTLSRGKGVPAETRAAAKQIRALLERQQQASVVTALRSSRIGLEGETRLCAEFGNREDAQAALADIRKLSSGVDMINVVEEPCPSPKDKAP